MLPIRYYYRMETESFVLCLVRDLLFYSKIRAIAETSHIPLKTIRDAKKIVEPSELDSAAALIVDLNQPECLQSAIAWRTRTGQPVIGFVSHVDSDIIQAARAGGLDQVLARSQFEKNLPAILAGLQ